VLVYALTAWVLAVPLLIADVPLGVDDLNHLARIYVRAHIDTDPDLARLFEVRTRLIPYLGMDVLLTPIARMMPIMAAGRLYILALVWGLMAAVVAVRLAFTSRVGLAPAATGLIAYNGLLAWGFLTYMPGLILALLMFAGWHSLRRRPWHIRLVLFTAASTVICLTHLLGFVLYGILVVSYEVFGRPRPWRTPPVDWIVLAGQALPAVCLFYAATDTVSSIHLGFHYEWKVKFLVLLAPMVFDGIVGGLDTGLLTFVVCGTALIVGLRRGWVTWPRELAAPILVLLALTIVLPFRGLGIAFLDYRLTVVAASLALAGLTFVSLSPARIMEAGAVAAALIVAHVVNVSIVMHGCDAQYAELRDAMSILPRGVELTTVLDGGVPAPGTTCTMLPIYLHMGQLATIDRSGYAPDFFALITSVGVRGGRMTDRDPESPDSLPMMPAGAYLLWMHFGHHRPAPAGQAVLRHGSFFDLDGPTDHL
jgi:hypothetical protein